MHQCLVVFLYCSALSSTPDHSPDFDIEKAFEGKVVKDCWLKPIPDPEYKNPCSITGDYDGDGKQDVAVWVVEKAAPRRRGVAVETSGGRHYLLGAGVAIGNGGDDFKWATVWRTVRKAELRLVHFRAAKADGILVDDPIGDSGGGAIVLVRGRPQWKQWSD